MRRYENVKIENLKPYKNNARTHSEEQVNKIAKSIEQFGFVNPVLIDGNFVIIAGHGRVMAAKQLGMTEVPCIFVEDLTEAQKRAYIIADNKLAEEAEWNNEVLISELEELKDLNFDIELTGFDKIDFEKDELLDINDNGLDSTKKFEHKLRIDKTEIILTDEEFEKIMNLLNDYITDNGVAFGFVSHLIGDEE